MGAQLELVRAAPLDLTAPEPRADHAVIARLLDENVRVLDVGCGDGALLTLLKRECAARGAGVERDGAKVRACVARGLSVVQADAEQALREFPSASFDVVVFSHTLQHLAAPREALREAGRVGARVIVSIRNAGHWANRARLTFQGRAAPHWAEANAARLCSVRDMAETARAARLTIESAVPISRGRAGAPFAKTLWRANWFAEDAVFLLAP
ncbi:MAG: methyltransferase domain-containing protein [Hyphomonadaceae bacterium]|nr:methyltransferase domain-containing protein [Hyphomonadaceae bacterium]